MSLEIAPGTAYRDIAKPDQKVPNINLDEKIPNINRKEKPLSDTLFNNNRDGNNQENEKKGLVNSEKQIKSAISKANNHLKFTGTRCEFTYYDDINRVAIKVVDKITNEVIREIPPEETLELVQKLWEFAGLLYDEKG